MPYQFESELAELLLAKEKKIKEKKRKPGRLVLISAKQRKAGCGMVGIACLREVLALYSVCNQTASRKQQLQPADSQSTATEFHTPFMWQTEEKHGTNQELEQHCTAHQIHYICCTGERNAAFGEEPERKQVVQAAYQGRKKTKFKLLLPIILNTIQDQLCSMTRVLKYHHQSLWTSKQMEKCEFTGRCQSASMPSRNKLGVECHAPTITNELLPAHPTPSSILGLRTGSRECSSWLKNSSIPLSQNKNKKTTHCQKLRLTQGLFAFFDNFLEDMEL
ncbi:hypothetical protein EK904_011842 [Melospiza melodia maxima]|nr:hypothetical protein EK904_011842 [Melospiza melodia maxima]